MLDISKATNMLTSLGVSSTLAAKVAKRAAQNQGGTDALAFLKELQATLKEFSTSDTAGSDVTRAAPTTVASTKPYQSTSALYSTGTETNGAAEATAKALSTTSPNSGPGKRAWVTRWQRTTRSRTTSG